MANDVNPRFSPQKGSIRMRRLVFLLALPLVAQSPVMLQDGDSTRILAGSDYVVGHDGLYPRYVLGGSSWVPIGQPLTLGWHVQEYSKQVPVEGQRRAILAAMREWSRYAQIRWIEMPDSQTSETSPTVNIWWTCDPHGDSTFPPYAGHTFLPCSVTSLCGAIHFDDCNVKWTTGRPDDQSTPMTYSIYNTILHELGHALGLAHSTLPNVVMSGLPWYFYNSVDGLRPDDIAAIQSLYAPASPTQSQAIAGKPER